MKKFFMALMAIAAITFTACEPKNNPDKPNNENPTDSIPAAKPADITVALCLDVD